MSFSNLKKSTQNNTEFLTKELDRQSKGSFQKDERLWNVERDKAGNGFAIIRFLPACEGEDVPWVQMYSHSFKNSTGAYFIENCPTTKGRGTACPVCEANSILWNSNIKSNQELVSKLYKRRLRYTSNILVISDPAHRENEGKVFLFNYGTKIHDKIVESMKPKFAQEQAINPFDFWAGRNFKIKVKTVGTGENAFANYDDSEWMAQGPLYDDDKKMELVWNQQYKLQPLIADNMFKSYDDLKKRYQSVMGTSANVSSTSTVQPPTTPEAVAASAKPPFTSKKPVQVSSTEEDSNMEYFKRLSEE